MCGPDELESQKQATSNAEWDQGAPDTQMDSANTTSYKQTRMLQTNQVQNESMYSR